MILRSSILQLPLARSHRTSLSCIISRSLSKSTAKLFDCRLSTCSSYFNPRPGCVCCILNANVKSSSSSIYSYPAGIKIQVRQCSSLRMRGAASSVISKVKSFRIPGLPLGPLGAAFGQLGRVGSAFRQAFDPCLLLRHHQSNVS